MLRHAVMGGWAICVVWALVDGAQESAEMNLVVGDGETSPNMAPPGGAAAAMRAQAMRICESGVLGKSRVYQRLFLYLVEKSTQNQPPKELDVAVDVFAKDATFNAAEDSVVRVNMHALRSRLEEYYRGAGAADPVRLGFPKGGYRVTLVETPADVRQPRPASSRWHVAILGLLLMASLTMSAYLLMHRAPAALPANELSSSFVWAPLNQSRRPVTIILGDLFMYGEIDPATNRPLSIRDPTINSADVLNQRIRQEPALAAHLSDRQTTLLPKSVAQGLAAVLPLISKDKVTKIVIAAELSLDDLRESDVIYLGPLFRLGPLADLYFQQSQYRYDGAIKQLEDRETRQKYAATGDSYSHRTDYALFTALPGPSGNRIMIFASVASDIGLQQIVRSLTTASSLAELKSRLIASGGAEGSPFEVLTSATGHGRTDFKAEIVAVRALRSVAVPPK